MVAVSETEEKGTSRNVATWGSLCSHPFQRLFTLACPSLCFLFPAVYPCISDTMSSYFPKLGLARVATSPREESERNRAIPLVGTPPSEVENQVYARLEISDCALIRSAQVRLGIFLTNVFWVVDWLTALGFYHSLSLPFYYFVFSFTISQEGGGGYIYKRNCLPLQQRACGFVIRGIKCIARISYRRPSAREA